MRRKTRAGRFAVYAMLTAVTVVMPVYGASGAETGHFVDDVYNPRNYDGIVTDEMIEGWEREKGTDSFTDAYGSGIEWDIHGSGDEDGAGYESSADMMEAPAYGSEEQEEILESIRETAEQAGKGWIYIKGELGDDWPGYNVTIALYDGNHKRVEITAYSQNGFEVKREVPAGVYKVYRAYVPGDENGNQYPLIVSDSSIEILKDGTAELVVWRGDSMKGKKETKEENLSKEAELQPQPPQSSALSDVMAIISIGIGTLLIFMLGAVGYKKYINLDRYQ